MILAPGLALSLAACGPQPLHESGTRGDGLDVSTLPAAVRGDYQVFAQRCSKCHALARALESGIDDDAFWKRYVERMRHQPSSGITLDDQAKILNFLHHYSTELRRTKAMGTVGRIPSTPRDTSLARVP
ncbi:MAG: hypothetical protein ABI193_18885 [Minicystis sp.]